MKKFKLSNKDYKTLKNSIKIFEKIDGDKNKSLELEDFYALAEISRSLFLILKPYINKAND